MNMLASLKTLLFASAAMGGKAVTAGAASVAEGASDFAAILDGAGLTADIATAPTPTLTPALFAPEASMPVPAVAGTTLAVAPNVGDAMKDGTILPSADSAVPEPDDAAVDTVTAVASLPARSDTAAFLAHVARRAQPIVDQMLSVPPAGEPVLGMAPMADEADMPVPSVGNSDMAAVEFPSIEAAMGETATVAMPLPADMPADLTIADGIAGPAFVPARTPAALPSHASQVANAGLPHPLPAVPEGGTGEPEAAGEDDDKQDAAQSADMVQDAPALTTLRDPAVMMPSPPQIVGTSVLQPDLARPESDVSAIAAAGATGTVSPPRVTADLPVEPGSAPIPPSDAPSAVVPEPDFVARDTIQIAAIAPEVPTALTPGVEKPVAPGGDAGIATPAPHEARHAAAPAPDAQGMAPAIATEQVLAPADATEQVLAQAPLPTSEQPPAMPPVPGGRPLAEAVTPAIVADAKIVDQAAPIALAVDAQSDQAPAIADTDAMPARAEALSLLQLARDHMSRRKAPTTEREGQAAAVAHRKGDAIQADVGSANVAGVNPGADVVPVTSSPAVLPSTSANVAGMARVDLSASLGAQVVDMGVSGQWIDGLARDIAGLSANGAQGRFQINTDQLGAVQVDIRQDSDGAAVSLTVATEAAEQALRQDSDRLRLDSSLSAVRITDVKVERAPHVSEAARADSGGQSNGQQPSSSHGQSTAWQGAGQSAGQGMGQSPSQGRWQSRENNGLAHKAGGDPVVLNHADAGDAAGDARRARYA